jgi:hypothetical protein
LDRHRELVQHRDCHLKNIKDRPFTALRLLDAEEALPRQSLPMSPAEEVSYVGKYVRPETERPEIAEIFLKEGQPYLRAFWFEQPITRLSADTFSVAVPDLRGPWRFKLLAGPTGKVEYLCLSLGVMKKVN